MIDRQTKAVYDYHYTPLSKVDKLNQISIWLSEHDLLNQQKAEMASLDLSFLLTELREAEGGIWFVGLVAARFLLRRNDKWFKQADFAVLSQLWKSLEPNRAATARSDL